MRLRALLAGTLATLVMAPPAIAEDWRLLANNGNSSVYVEMSTIQRSNGHTYVWSKIQFNGPQPIGDGTTYTILTAQSDLDCSARTYQNLQYHFYDATVREVRTETADDQPVPIESGQPLEWVAQAVC